MREEKGIIEGKTSILLQFFLRRPCMLTMLAKSYFSILCDQIFIFDAVDSNRALISMT